MDTVEQSKRKEVQPNDHSDMQHRLEISRFLDDPGNPNYQGFRTALGRLLEAKTSPPLLTQD